MLDSLYELSADPAEALASLVALYGDMEHEGPLLAAIEKLLADVSIQPEVMARVKGAYDHPESRKYPLLRGPLGLCLFLDHVTAASLYDIAPKNPDNQLEGQAKRLLKSPLVKKSLRTMYRLDEHKGLKDCDLADAALYKVGTTSVIIECERGESPAERVALKCVLPRHFSVRAITDGAEDYGERHKAVLTLAPTVYGSSDRAVLMEFIPGETLAERLAKDQVPEQRDDPRGEKRAALRALRPTDIEFIRELGLTLCETLEELSETSQCHLDLSPRNIILVGKRPLNVRLIDFGRNFAIAEGVASSMALARASVYAEPQMITHERKGDWRSDCYSFGIILLEAAARAPLQRGTVRQELWRLWTGEHAWDGAPGLARIIEDLIDAKPEQRLAFMPAEDWERRKQRRRSEPAHVG